MYYTIDCIHPILQYLWKTDNHIILMLNKLGNTVVRSCQMQRDDLPTLTEKHLRMLWSQRIYLKASNKNIDDKGWSTDLSSMTHLNLPRVNQLHKICWLVWEYKVRKSVDYPLSYLFHSHIHHWQLPWASPGTCCIFSLCSGSRRLNYKEHIHMLLGPLAFPWTMELPEQWVAMVWWGRKDSSRPSPCLPLQTYFYISDHKFHSSYTKFASGKQLFLYFQTIL